jgi:DNA-binding transcriptional LysR family regulator
MLDGVSLDQLRTFIAAVDEGSFSAAGRRLGRAQSVVSQTLATLEGQLGVQLFDRSARYPALTDRGSALLPEARAVAGRMDAFKARARDLASGLEPELSVSIDVMLPIFLFTHAVTDFQATFPDTPLRVHVEALGAVLQPVIDGRCAFAVMGSLPLIPPEFSRERLISIRLIMTASPITRWHGTPRQSRAMYWPSTCSSSSPTAPSFRPARNSACCRRRSGGSPIWAPSTHSCAPAWAGAACRKR